MFGIESKKKRLDRVQRQIVRLVELREKIAPIEAEIAELEKEVRAYAVESGETFKYDGVEVRYRPAGTRQTWDGKGLAGYAIAHPEVLAFRKEAETAASAAIYLPKRA